MTCVFTSALQHPFLAFVTASRWHNHKLLVCSCDLVKNKHTGMSAWTTLATHHATNLQDKREHNNRHLAGPGQTALSVQAVSFRLCQQVKPEGNTINPNLVAAYALSLTVMNIRCISNIRLAIYCDCRRKADEESSVRSSPPARRMRSLTLATTATFVYIFSGMNHQR